VTTDNKYIKQGSAYTFITNGNQQWSFSDLSLNSTDSLAGRTLAPLYETTIGQANLGYILYNDQADKVTIIKGHTKGVILFNENSAVWLVHSIPHYPPKPSTKMYMINPSQCVYGQSMLCMSVGIDQLELIGQQLLFNDPQVYDSNIPDSLRQLKPVENLLRVLKGEHVDTEPYSNVNELTTLGGEKFISFAKAAEYEQDL
jgi:deoxyribonuclease-2